MVTDSIIYALIKTVISRKPFFAPSREPIQLLCAWLAGDLSHAKVAKPPRSQAPHRVRGDD
jgi:hypothetical protein